MALVEMALVEMALVEMALVEMALVEKWKACLLAASLSGARCRVDDGTLLTSPHRH
jgi:hypothetical protein